MNAVCFVATVTRAGYHEDRSPVVIVPCPPYAVNRAVYVIEKHRGVQGGVQTGKRNTQQVVYVSSRAALYRERLETFMPP